MNGLFGRALGGVLAATLGMLLGWWAGRFLGYPAAGTALGALVGMGVHHLRDAWAAGRLLRWLRHPNESSSPRGPALWSEIGYRIERHLELHRRENQAERLRLRNFLDGIEASPNGVVLLDADDRIEWCNAAAGDHLGLSPSRDRLQPITNLVRQPAFVAHLQGREWSQPLLLTMPLNDVQLSVLVRAYGDHSKLVLSQDVTERARAEAMRRDFVANVSHEIRTPLTVLAGYVETLSVIKLSEPERARVLETMRQQAERMNTLVGDLLQLAQLEGSPRPPLDRWVELNPLLRRAIDEASTLSAGRHEFVFAPEHEHLVAADATELHSAIGNLLHNAVRYTPDGSRIDLRVAELASGGGSIEVADNGPGIGAEHLPRLTERFYRVDRGRSRETGGTGLGLAIVKHVAQRHGGSLEIESAVGAGTLFRLCLPPVRWRTGGTVVAEPAVSAGLEPQGETRA